MRPAFRAITMGLVFCLASTICVEAPAEVNPFHVRNEVEELVKLRGRRNRSKAKEQYQRWYDGYQIVVSEVTRSYGDGRLPHLTAVE